jgi:hypothetical protein
MNGTGRANPAARLLAPGFAIAAAVLVPWLFLLASTLPASVRARHWSTAWVGFDILLAASLAACGWLAWRRSRTLVLTATATGTLLLVDAWFDVLTSAPGAGFTQAIALAVCCELPLSVGCLVVAFRAHRRT